MARRNRRRRVQGFAFPVPFAGIIVVVSVLALGYIWLGCCCESVGRDIKVLEAERRELDKQQVNERYRWARMKAPRSLERALGQHSIEMVYPRHDQVVDLRTLPVGGGQYSGVGSSRQLARADRDVRNE